MHNRATLALALSAVLLVGAGCSQSPAPAANAPETPGSTAVQPSAPPASTTPAKGQQPGGTAPASKVVTVVMNNGGFSPNPVTITHGTTVKFVNQGDSSIWPASNPHPVHTAYAGFDPRHGVAPGDSWSYTFNRVGTWGYHNHLSPLTTGTIIVK